MEGEPKITKEERRREGRRAGCCNHVCTALQGTAFCPPDSHIWLAGREIPPNLLHRRKSAPASPPPLESLLIPPPSLQVREPDGGRRAAFACQTQAELCSEGGTTSISPIEQQPCESAENKHASQGAGCIENISSVRRAAIAVLSYFASLIRNWRQRMARCNM